MYSISRSQYTPTQMQVQLEAEREAQTSAQQIRENRKETYVYTHAPTHVRTCAHTSNHILSPPNPNKTNRTQTYRKRNRSRKKGVHLLWVPEQHTPLQKNEIPGGVPLAAQTTGSAGTQCCFASCKSPPGAGGWTASTPGKSPAPWAAHPWPPAAPSACAAPSYLYVLSYDPTRV